MGYEKKTWKPGDLISADAMNRIESELKQLDSQAIVRAEITGSECKFYSLGDNLVLTLVNFTGAQKAEGHAF